MKGAIIAVIVIALLGGGVGFLLFLLRRKKQQEIAAMSPQERASFEAEKEHKTTVRAWDKQVATANHDFQRLQSQVNQVQGKYSGVRLYENRVETPQGTIYFENGPVEAMADTAGNLAVTQRITLTRLVAGGIVGGIIFPKKKKHDTRELYLLIKSPTLASLVECQPDDGPKVRALATSINNAALSASSRKQARELATTQAQAKLAEVTTARALAVGESERRLQSLRALIPGTLVAAAPQPSQAQAGGTEEWNIRRNIVINNQTVFESGEQVFVEGISPDPNRPEYRYVVLSKTLNKRFRLSDNDVSV